jgi:hypothetical protein
MDLAPQVTRDACGALHVPGNHSGNSGGQGAPDNHGQQGTIPRSGRPRSCASASPAEVSAGSGFESLMAYQTARQTRVCRAFSCPAGTLRKSCGLLPVLAPPVGIVLLLGHPLARQVRLSLPLKGIVHRGSRVVRPPCPGRRRPRRRTGYPSLPPVLQRHHVEDEEDVVLDDPGDLQPDLSVVVPEPEGRPAQQGYSPLGHRQNLCREGRGRSAHPSAFRRRSPAQRETRQRKAA